MKKFEELYHSARADRWMQRFAVFCRVALAASFIPSGYVKIMGERFTSLSSNNPLGHYFDALYLTGYYYTFLGIVQIITAVLLLIPRTSFLGALSYFPIILNIVVLTYALRFDGTRIVSLLLLASVFLLVWDYRRLKLIFSVSDKKEDHAVQAKPMGRKTRFWFFSGSFCAVAFVIVINSYLYELRPGNAMGECQSQCEDSRNPAACEAFCDCIHNAGQSLDTCLAIFDKAKDVVRRY
ncbi:MAG: hypothetical protein ACO1NS_02160 [Daejeonella sp.]|uniref:hypothetical protein n=1 Tax=Daejeonella sp. JGW-45 TaxID=3034148 RepID=UPI0023EBA989|nr:hypothetical protein [Daejeonella sp. JGW-45]